MSQAGIINVAGGGGGGTPIFSITGNTGGPETPVANNFNILGATVAAGTTPFSFAGSPGTETGNIQLTQASASSAANKAGLASFNSADFSVDANGFVTFTGTFGVSSVTGTANQILASPTSGAVVLSLIGPYTPATYTAHSVLVGEGTSSIVGVGPTANTGAVLQNNSGADPTYSTAKYPSTTTISQILYSSAANVVSGLATLNNGVLITSATGVPSLLADGTTGQVLTATTGSPPTWTTLSSVTLNYTNVNHAASPYTVLSTDQYISVDASAGTVSLLFPNAPTAERTWIIKDRTGSASTNNISITTVGGSVTIDGQTTYKLVSNYSSIQLLANAVPNYEVY